MPTPSNQTRVFFHYSKFHTFETTRFYCDGDSLWALIQREGKEVRVRVGLFSHVKEIQHA